MLTVLVPATLVSRTAGVWHYGELAISLSWQLLAAASAATLLAASVRARRVMVIGLLTVAVHVWTVLSAAAWTRSATDFDGGTRVASINCLSSNVHDDATIEAIRSTGAHVVGVLELTPRLSRRLRDDLSDQYPHQTLAASGVSNFGIGLISRRPLNKVRRFNLAGGPIAIAAEVDGLNLLFVHPVTPMTAETFDRRNQQITAVADWCVGRPGPTAVLGDFNTTMWSPHVRRMMDRAGLRRAGGWTGLMRPTWFLGSTVLSSITIDHVLTSDDVLSREVAVGEPFGSDHRSVAVTLAVSTE